MPGRSPRRLGPDTHLRPLSRTALCLPLIALALVACGPQPPMPAGDSGTVLPGTYANVSTILGRTCAFTSCHGGVGSGAAMLNVQRSIADGTLVTDLQRPSCEYSAMPLLTPGDASQSWLYLKVHSAHTGLELDFTPDASWDHGGLTPDATGHYPASTCPLTSAGQITFGQIMPMGTGGLPPDQAETIRLWIEAGAPGP